MPYLDGIVAGNQALGIGGLNANCFGCQCRAGMKINVRQRATA